jgi:nucleoside-diphosphate-sugar epimerase
MKNIFITGESGVIPMAMQHMLTDSDEFKVVNSQINDVYGIKHLKKHQSFKIREPEIDFLDTHLLNFGLKDLWEDVDIIIHSGAYVGSDFCNEYPEQAIKTNVQGTKNIVDICNKHKIKLIYFSTTAIFDPNDYSESKPITEKTEITPQTLYGISKYAGEMICKKLCEQPTLIVRPVFGFGDFPHDLHSAITKIIFTYCYNQEYKEKKKIEVLLNPSIQKSYTRVENIANTVIALLNFEDSDEINIGEPYLEARNWGDILLTMGSVMLQTHWTDLHSAITFIPSKDYLHYHNIDNTKMKRMGIDFKSFENYIDFETGIAKTIDSTLKNINYIKPYWI